MTTETYNRPLRRLTASEGHTITRRDYNPEYPYFSPVAYLGAGDSEDNYMEVTIEEAEAIIEAARLKAETDNKTTFEPD